MSSEPAIYLASHGSPDRRNMKAQFTIWPCVQILLRVKHWVYADGVKFSVFDHGLHLITEKPLGLQRVGKCI